MWITSDLPAFIPMIMHWIKIKADLTVNKTAI